MRTTYRLSQENNMYFLKLLKKRKKQYQLKPAGFRVCQCASKQWVQKNMVILENREQTCQVFFTLPDIYLDVHTWLSDVSKPFSIVHRCAIVLALRKNFSTEVLALCPCVWKVIRKKKHTLNIHLYLTINNNIFVFLFYLFQLWWSILCSKSNRAGVLG